MKKYTGTKTIMAMPMEKSEAEQKLNRTIDSKEEEGYFIEYPDGYKSWSPKSVFEEAYRPSETRLDRMRIEYEQVRENYLKASAFMLTEDFRALPKDSQRSLEAQSNAMYAYLGILSHRIDEAKGEESKKEAQVFQQAQTEMCKSLVGLTVVEAGRCDDCPSECGDCKKLILADGSHICLKDTSKVPSKQSNI